VLDILLLILSLIRETILKHGALRFDGGGRSNGYEVLCLLVRGAKFENPSAENASVLVETHNTPSRKIDRGNVGKSIVVV
jgi:hypothetical protein